MPGIIRTFRTNRHCRPVILAAVVLLAGHVFAASAKAAGEWFPGDIHIHATGASWDGDKISFPEDIKKVALERGLRFVVLTDHSDATGSKDATEAYYNLGPEFTYWEKAKALSEPGRFLMIDGNEISPLPQPPTRPGGHIGCVPVDQNTFDLSGSFTDRPPGAVKAETAIRQCRERGGYVIVNHAYNFAPWVEFDWTSRDYDALEVFNGGMFFDKYDQRVLKAGLCDWALGKRTVLVGGSDTHRVYIPQGEKPSESALGLPTTYIHAPALARPDLMKSLKTGKVVVRGTGVFVDFQLMQNGKALGTMGDTVKLGEGALLLSASGTVPVGKEMSLKIIFVPKGGCEDTRQPGKNTLPKVKDTVLAEHRFTPATPNFSHTFDLKPPGEGALMLLLIKAAPLTSEKYVALTNAVFLEK